MMSTTTRMALPAAILYGVVGVLLATLVIGIPTDVVPNPIFGRPTTPVRTLDYAFLATTALLTGLLAASYAFPQTRACASQQSRTTVGGLLSFLAIGCPTCNKVVVLAIGASGAMEWFAPLQPVLGVASIILLAIVNWVRWRPVFQRSSLTAGEWRLSPTHHE